MKKKIRDISIDDIIKLCNKYYCDECPVASYLCIDCSDLRDLDFEYLEQEIEVPENE